QSGASSLPLSSSASKLMSVQELFQFGPPSSNAPPSTGSTNMKDILLAPKSSLNNLEVTNMKDLLLGVSLPPAPQQPESTNMKDILLPQVKQSPQPPQSPQPTKHAQPGTVVGILKSPNRAASQSSS